MNSWLHIVILAVLFALGSACVASADGAGDYLVAQSPESDDERAATIDREEVEAYFRELQQSFAKRDLERFLSGYSENFDADFEIVTRDRVRSSAESLFRSAFAEFVPVPRSIEFIDGHAIATVFSSIAYGKSREAARVIERDAVWILRRRQPDSDKLEVATRFTVDRDAQERLTKGVYSSPAGGYSLTRPDGWILFAPQRAPYHIFDLTWMYRPSTRSIIGLSVVDLPREERDARRLARIEVDNMLAEPDQDSSSDPLVATDLAGVPAYRIDYAATDDETAQWVRKYHSVRERLYTTLYFQAPSRKIFESQLAGFESVRASLAFHEPGVPRRGTIDGPTFRHDEPACEIRVPAGWTAAPAAGREVFRVFVMPPDGDGNHDSRVMFFAERLLRSSDTTAAEQLDRYVRGTIRKIQASFPGATVLQEPQALKTRHGLNGISATITLPTRPESRLRKVVAFLSDDHLLIFQCDAIPATRFEALSPGFDEIVSSLKVLE